MSDTSRVGGRRSWLPEALVLLGAVGLFAFVVGGALVLNIMRTLPPAATTIPMTPAPLGIAPVGGHGKIAFASSDPINVSILVMEPDGGNLARLTNQTGYYYDFAWSPDGTRIAFGDSTSGNSDVVVLRTDTLTAAGSQGAASKLINLTNSISANDYSPDWSPDGKRIVFVSDHSAMVKLYLAAADGSRLSVVTTGASFDTQPDWSPDGKRIVFTSQVNGVQHLYLVDPDGTRLTALTSGDGQENSPRWSPDATQIAYLAVPYAVGPLCVIRPDGSGQRCLTGSELNAEKPEWSPDGKRIVFKGISAQMGQELYVINADGSGLTRLTNDQGQDDEPSWSPDGTQIVFTSGRDGNSEIYVVNADGTGLTRLTNSPSQEISPQWSR